MGVTQSHSAVFCIFEISFATSISIFGWEHPILWYVLCTLAVIFSINFVVDSGKFLNSDHPRFKYPVELSLRKRISWVYKIMPADNPGESRNKAVQHLHLLTPPVFQSGMVPGVWGVSPASQSYNMSRGSPGNLSQSSTPQGGVTMNMSNNMSYQTPSPHNHSNSPFLVRDGINSFGGSGSLLRSRHQTPPTVNRSPLSAEDTISDMNSLNNYLKAHEDRRTLIGESKSELLILRRSCNVPASEQDPYGGRGGTSLIELRGAQLLQNSIAQ
ncbi:hypothetical protein BSL78_05904 [Apostichopus japonicus]|uniref:Uncharacterized protein n=1 Tax=Stichopus japonicus TaxID=307972 RepID=A0A2G8LAG6_STIJA|nr:hypothetical protein BSL78_05904 [Apostichopus japonicus]